MESRTFLKRLLTQSLWLCLALALSCSRGLAKPQILLLGTDHFSQTYREGKPNTDVLQAESQVSLAKLIAKVSVYKADAVMVEVLPSKQEEVDEKYSKFLAERFNLADEEYPRHELYQLAFPLARKLELERIDCVNAIGGTSQSILDNGDNIEIYQAKGKELRDLAIEKYTKLAEGDISFCDFIHFLNTPEAYNKIYELRYMTPARVRNGSFTNPDARVPPKFFLEPEYIGAELISIFKNRDFKIYSNIVSRQLETDCQRILVIIGTGHVGSLRSIFRDDPEFELLDALDFL